MRRTGNHVRAAADSARLVISVGDPFRCRSGGGSRGLTDLVSVRSNGKQGDGISGRASAPSASADGVVVAFDSSAANLVAGDTNGAVDVFVRDLIEAHLIDLGVTYCQLHDASFRNAEFNGKAEFGQAGLVPDFPGRLERDRAEASRQWTMAVPVNPQAATHVGVSHRAPPPCPGRPTPRTRRSRRRAGHGASGRAAGRTPARSPPPRRGPWRARSAGERPSGGSGCHG